MQLVDVNAVAVVVAAAVNMLVGGVWYSPAMLGPRWMKAIGKKAKDLKEGASTAMVGAGIASLVMAFILAHFVQFAEATTFVEGATVGIWAWFGFVVTTHLARVLYEDGNKEIYLISMGYNFVSFLLMGGILAIWI